MDKRHFLLGLHLTDGIGAASEALVIAAFEREDVQNWALPWDFEQLALILGVSDTQRWERIRQDYAAALQRAEQLKAPYLTYFDAAYPSQLREIYQPPLILFYEGQLAALQLPSLAVVGTRTATPYGLAVLRELLPPIVRSGVAIVSGLARGIDVMAHQVTFANNGVPIAVIGTGIDIAYPKNNGALQTLIGQQGLVLSEYAPGVGPHKSHFPARNRILAGLASATLVIEAKQRSGSLITANLALQNNREVLAVPGPIFSENSAGTNQLISAGAKVVTSTADIIESMIQFDK